MDSASVAKVLIFVVLIQGASCQNWLDMILGTPPKPPQPKRNIRRNNNMGFMNPLLSGLFGSSMGMGGGLFGMGMGAGHAQPNPFLRSSQITTAEEQMSEVLTETGKNNPDRKRMEGVIGKVGGRFTGDLAALNYIVQDFWMTTPGPVPPPNKLPAKKGSNVMPVGGKTTVKGKGGILPGLNQVGMGPMGVNQGAMVAKPPITWQQLGKPSGRRRSNAALAAAKRMNTAGAIMGAMRMGNNNNFGMGTMAQGPVPRVPAMGMQNNMPPQAGNSPVVTGNKPANFRTATHTAKVRPGKSSRQQQIRDRIAALRVELNQLKAKTVNGKNPKLLGVQNQLNGLVKLEKKVANKAKRQPKGRRVEVITRPPTLLKQGTIPVRHRPVSPGMKAPTTAGYGTFGLVDPALTTPPKTSGQTKPAPYAVAHIPLSGQGQAGPGQGAGAGANGAMAGTTVQPQLGEVRYLNGHKYVYTDADGFDTFQWIKQAPGQGNQNPANEGQVQEGQGNQNQANEGPVQEGQGNQAQA